MIDWENLRCFLAVAQAESMSGAARILKVDHATVSRRIGILETELQIRLFDRLPRSCKLTYLEWQVFSIATEIEDRVSAVERVARAGQSTLNGRVTISVPPALASTFFAKQVFAFKQLNPNILLSIISQSQSVSLVQREADIAVRLFRPTEPSNVTRRLGGIAYALYASRNYEHVNNPANWEFITFGAQLADMPHQKWLLEIAGER